MTDLPSSSPLPLFEILSETGEWDGSFDDIAALATTGNIFDWTLFYTGSAFAAVAENGTKWSDIDRHPRLITHSCMSEDDPTNPWQPCNEVCTDPEALFSSWQTLASCLSLASISITSRRHPGIDEEMGGQISLALSRVSMASNITEEFNATGVLAATMDCVSASCRADSMGHCDEEFETGSWLSRSRLESADYLSPRFCAGIQGNVNIDIAGPGVLLSYLLQSCLALLLWLIIHAATLNTTTVPLLRLIRGTRSNNALSGLSAPLDRLRKSNFFYSTASFVADFHEAQCYFIIAVSIALIHAQHQSASFNGTNNWHSLTINQYYIGTISSAGSIPPILTQLTLHHLGMDSVYSLSCLTLTYIMATISVMQFEGLDATKVARIFEDKEALVECGDHPSLRTFCAVKALKHGLTWPKWVIFPWAILIEVLWLLRIWSLVSMRRAATQRQKNSKAKLHTPLHPGIERLCLFGEGVAEAMRLRPVATTIVKGIVFLSPVAVLCVMGIQMSRLEALQRILADSFDSSKGWNVGQVLAVLLWAPVIARYLYTVAFGVQGGFSIRLFDEFVIVKRSDTSRLPFGWQKDETGERYLRQEAIAGARDGSSTSNMSMGSDACSVYGHSLRSEEGLLPKHDAVASRLSPA